MKYTIATIVLGAMGICVLGASEFHTQRTEQVSALMKENLSAMSQQQLLVARRGCEPSTEQGIVLVGYCTEVQRIIDSQPLQFVIQPRSFIVF